MINILRNAIVLSAILSIAMGTAFAQHHDDSIEQSWNRAAASRQYKQTPQPMQQAGQDDYSQPWEHMTFSDESQWPYMPSNPTEEDFYTVNKTLLDSLSNLYCVSPGYIRELERRNDAHQLSAGHQAPPPQNARFSYKNGQQRERQAQTHGIREESLKGLNRELFQLLNTCLNR